MSGSSVAAGDLFQSEGGFISFGTGNYLSSPVNDFVASASANFAGSDFLSLADPALYDLHHDLDARAFAIATIDDPWQGTAFQSTPPVTRPGAILATSGSGERTQRPQVDTNLFDTIAEEFPDVARAGTIVDGRGAKSHFNGGGGDVSQEEVAVQGPAVKPPAKQFDLSLSYLPEVLQTIRRDTANVVQHDMLPEVDKPHGGKSIATMDVAPALSGWVVMLTMDGDLQRFSPSRDYVTATEGQATVIAEGGAIEVNAAVVDTQQAYEARVFSSAARLLDEKEILVQPAPPVPKPLHTELARAMALELAGFAPTPPTVPLADAYGPNNKVFAEPTIHASLSTPGEDAESDLSRALAFAQWPLMFSATAGAVLVAGRRRTQPRLAQQPPRRNQQTIVR